MTETPVIQGRYDQLVTIAQRFGQQAQTTERLHRRLYSSSHPLEDGGWKDWAQRMD
jgi:hypothetical protein